MEIQPSFGKSVSSESRCGFDGQNEIAADHYYESADESADELEGRRRLSMDSMDDDSSTEQPYISWASVAVFNPPAPGEQDIVDYITMVDGDMNSLSDERIAQLLKLYDSGAFISTVDDIRWRADEKLFPKYDGIYADNVESDDEVGKPANGKEEIIDVETVKSNDFLRRRRPSSNTDGKPKTRPIRGDVSSNSDDEPNTRQSSRENSFLLKKKKRRDDGKCAIA